MKSTLLFLIALFCSEALLAADWDLFPPNQKMYFYNEDAAALDWFIVQPAMVPYHLTSNKYTDFSGSNGCAFDSTYYSLGMLEKYRWHFDELYVAPGLTQYPAPSSQPLYGEFTYYADSEVGQFWNIVSTDTLNDYDVINITCVSKEEDLVFGVVDSVKTFSLSANGSSPGQVGVNNFKLIVSKSFGVIEFVPFQLFIHHPAHIDFTSIKIIGIEKPGFKGGVTPPSLEDIVNYQQGEILNWENVVDNSNIKLFRDSITTINYLPQGLVYTFDRRITDVTGNAGVSYQNNLKQSFDFAELAAYSSPPQWGEFRYHNTNVQRLVKNESFYGIEQTKNDTIFRSALQATDLLLETTNCNHYSYTDYVDWQVFDNRYGLAEFGNVDLGITTENRLVVEGPCPGIDSSANCSDLPGNIDCDNGGLSNYQECLNGTDPLDPNDDFTVALPVELISLKANLNDYNKVDIEWITASEQNTDFFEVQRSRDKIDFEVIGLVQAAGSSNQKIRYQFNDANPPGGYVYYRLRMVDLDKSFTHTKVVTVNYIKDDHQITLFPNPIKGGNTVQLITDTEFRTEGLAVIQDITGKEIMSQALAASQIEHAIDLSNIAPGTYLLKLTFDGKRVTKKLLVN